MPSLLDNGWLLYKQDRYELALKEYMKYLHDHPNDDHAYALLAICHADLGAHKEARRHAETAIGLAPDVGYNHYALAYVLMRAGKLDKARASVRESIALTPEFAPAWSLLAQIFVIEQNWQEAIKAAEKAMEINPEDVMALNYTVMSLVHTNRTGEALSKVELVLQLDPENALSQANAGWVMLHRNRPVEALAHFKESLRIDPAMIWAREGIVSALKARNFVYRCGLSVSLALSRFNRYRIVWILLMIIPFTRGLVILLFLLSLLSNHFFNLLLSLDSLGKNALTAEEKLSSGWFCSWFTLAVVCSLLAGKDGFVVAVSGVCFIFIGAYTMSRSLQLDNSKAQVAVRVANYALTSLWLAGSLFYVLAKPLFMRFWSFLGVHGDKAVGGCSTLFCLFAPFVLLLVVVWLTPRKRRQRR